MAVCLGIANYLIGKTQCENIQMIKQVRRQRPPAEYLAVRNESIIK